MPAAAAIDWTIILATAILVVPLVLIVVLAFRIREDTYTPSGDPIGEVAERAHDLSAIAVGLSRAQLAATRTDGEADRILAELEATQRLKRQEMQRRIRGRRRRGPRDALRRLRAIRRLRRMSVNAPEPEPDERDDG